MTGVSGRERETYLSATKVKVKRNNSHLSVCGVMRDFFPSDVASETPVVSPVPLSSLRKLMMWRMYLTRMRTMQALPTTQQHSTVCYHVSYVRWYGAFLVMW
jgi:hypothetical protein